MTEGTTGAREIEALEIHVAHSCNLSCESCSHYSNQGHTGTLALDEADRWMNLWNRRLSPRRFSLLGGEPTIHPQLTEMVALSRRNWPTATLQLVTNGFLLPRHPRLPEVLGGDPNAYIAVSIHHTSPEYRERLMPAIELLFEWKRRYGVQFDCRPSHGNWTRRYRGFGATMMPFADGQPRQSWEHCHARLCKQLFEGRIWKCPAVAYLPMQDAKHKLGEAWKPYLGYEALSPSCSDEELDAFCRVEDEPCCGMCPAVPEHFQMPSPLVWHRSEPSNAG
jgi:MoaA/NifB/PqqE/SkfB family radical SAM enzyme